MAESDDTHHDGGPFSEERILRKGSDVGGYVIDGELGRGGMGIVYRAQHPVIGKRVAIKVLKPSLSERPSTVDRFVQEARAVNAIGHPNIVDIFAFGALPDGRSYLVMDLLQGESLRTRVKRGALRIDEVAYVLDEIASALIAAHDKGFIHRDLKPDNIFLVANPGRTDVKLLDFGLAKLLPTAGQRAFRTATGAQLGTPDYMSPEQLRGSGDIDPRSDIYSLGIVAIELLTGRRPLRYGDGSFDQGPVEQQLARVPMLPTELVQLVAAMVQAAPDDRPTLAAMRALLKRLRPSLPSISIDDIDEALPPTSPDRPALPPTDRYVPSISPSKVGARPVLPTPQAGAPVVPAAAPAPVSVPPAAAGLRADGVVHPSTRIGVPPPPVRSSRQQVVAQPARASTDSRVWLVVGLMLMLAGAIALAVVLAS